MKIRYLPIILVLFLLLYSCLSISCNGKGGGGMAMKDTDTCDVETNGEVMLDSIGMIMLCEDTIVMPAERFPVKIYNNSKHSKIQTGLSFKIEYYTDDGWVECPKKFGIVINHIGIELRPTGSHEFNIPLVQLKLDRKHQKYRVTKKIDIGALGDEICTREKDLSCIFYIIVPDSVNLDADTTKYIWPVIIPDLG